MKREITFALGEERITAFLVEGFFDFSFSPSPFHHHHYTEIHLLGSGKGRYLFPDREVTLKANEMLLIPSGLFHESMPLSADARHIALQAVLPMAGIRQLSLPSEWVQLLFQEIEQYKNTQKSARLSACLALIFSELIETGDASRPIRDPAFLIDDFFDHRYHQQISLEDVAAILELSPKQAGRLIYRYTGHTFRQELNCRRMEAARKLMKGKGRTLAQIAEKVGYQSYSGFWKAFHAEKQRET